MTSDDRHPAGTDALDLAISTGLPTPSLDPALAETARRLRAMHRPFDPPPAVADRMWEAIVNAAAAYPASSDWPARFPNRLPAPPTPVAGARPRPAWIGQLATAAVLLLTLAGAWLLLGSPWPPLAGRPTAVPGIEIGAPFAVVTETLVDARVDDVPVGEVDIWVERQRFRPGPAVNAQTEPFPGPVVVAVETGEVGGNFGGADERMRPGDQVVVPAGRLNSQWNVGAGEASVISISFASGEYVSSEWDETQIVVDALVPPFSADLAGGTVRVVLERLTLPPDATVAATAGQVEGIGVEVGTLGITLAGDDLPYGWESGVERTFGIGTMPRFIRPGTAMTLRNADDGPLVIYRVTVAPEDGPGAGSASARSVSAESE